MERNLNLAIHLNKRNGISVDVDEPETGESSRIVVPLERVGHNPKFNERMGNEIWWWIYEWIIQMDEEENK